MDIPATERLVILLDKVSHAGSSELDVANIDAFCCLVKNEPSLSSYSTKILAERIQSTQKHESLNALNLLEECMVKCGNKFQSIVGTFRFLNELVKLVSPKYLGGQTDQVVKTKILDLLLLWKVQYPHEAKIKEAYEMLCRQGVVHEQANQIKINSDKSHRTNNGLNNPRKNEDPTSLKIKQLIQAKNPDRVDIHAANLLIQNFYELEKKKGLRVLEIKKGRENVSILSEMIDHYSVAESSQDDLQLIKELHETCKNLQPMILLLTEEQNQDESVMSEALETNDLLVQVLDKFDLVVLGREPNFILGSTAQTDPILIDMQPDHLIENEDFSSHQRDSNKIDDLNVLAEIFGKIPEDINSSMMDSVPSTGILQPQTVLNSPPEQPISNKTQMDSMISELLKLNLTPGSSSQLPPVLKHDLDSIEVDVESITPSEEPPRTVIEQPKGMKVVLNFTKEQPNPNVAMIVATIANLSAENVINISLEVTLQENENKICDLKQLPASGTSLVKVRPFRAVEDLTQVLLISNPRRVNPKLYICMKYAEEKDPSRINQLVAVVNDLPNLF